MLPLVSLTCVYLVASMLQELVDLDGYFLEREPCLTCNDPEVHYTNVKLSNIKV